ncbi:MAG: hypothetical protein LQ340_006519 [Diploschistes diacapsis]|nr:MAG: hypothetical protein LQ340_006519 [Diploschistes diacapsis]
MPFIRPKKKLKALHWDKVDSPQVTVWATRNATNEEKEAKYMELSRRGVLDEVERLFLAREIKALGGGGGKKNDKKKVIASNLAHTFQISMAKFSQYPIDEVIRMIIECDKAVTQDNVVMEFLSKDELCTIPDNVSKLMAPYSIDWTGPDAKKSQREQDPAELTREDQIYLRTAYELHHYWRSRMRGLSLVRSFEPEYDEISKQLQEIDRVCNSLRNCNSLFSIFGLILDIGNFMNDANKQASGFKLNSLSRLPMLKDDKNELTLADAIESVVRRQYPEWESFTEEIGGVMAIQKVNVDQLQKDAKKYIDNIKNVQTSLDMGNLSEPNKLHPQDRVVQIVARSMKDARRKAEQMQLFLDTTKKTFDDIVSFFGEDPADENARRDFFAKFANFIVEWKKSQIKNHGLEESKRRNEASIARKRAANAPPSAQPESPTSPSSGVMDSLFEKLRAAGPQNRDQRDRRRRARLRERHQMRIASGEQMPDLTDLTKGPEAGDSDSADLISPTTALTTVPEREGGQSEGEDVADRAAQLLQGLRGDNNAEAAGPGSLRVRRRREGNDEERRARRRRRNGDDSAEPSPTVEQSQAAEPTIATSEDNELKPGAPVTTLSPPTPERGSEARPVSLSD